jgi:ATP-binding protein involved in chromosome partitioning
MVLFCTLKPIKWIHMTHLSQQQVEAALASYIDPYLKLDLQSAKLIKNIDIQDNQITLEIVVGYPMQGVKDSLVEEIKKHLAEKIGNKDIKIDLSFKAESHVGQRGLKALPNVKNIIAIASGKGGVGKSTLSVNLALALSKEGAQVGILDADIYGPSQPMMLGAMQPPEMQTNRENKVLLPIKRHGIQSMSIGYLIDQATPMVWRGPMVTTALQQLLNDTQWENLDYLIIDLPPGTGDIQLTMAQKIPVSAAIVVTTPQDLALLDARRAYEMFKKVNIPVLGIVENMSVHVCSQCGHVDSIFGMGGGERLAEEYGIEVLGRLPLNKQIREQTDAGNPTVIAEPEGEISQLYCEIARYAAAKLSLQVKDYSSKFPSIVIKND